MVDEQNVTSVGFESITHNVTIVWTDNATQETTTVFETLVDNVTNLNVTSELPENINSFDYNKVLYVTLPLFSVFGIVGNVLSLVIMQSKYFRHSTTSVYLSALAVSDTTFIFSNPFNQKFINDLFPSDPRALSVYGCQFFFFIYRNTKICGAWFVVVVCIERFIVVWFPLHAKVILNRRTAFITTTIVVLAIFAFDAFYTVATTKVIHGVCVPFVTTPSSLQLVTGFFIATVVVFNTIPTIMLVLLTPLTIGKLYSQQALRREISNSGRNVDTGRITRMLLVVMIAYLTLVTPISTAHTVAFFNGDNIFESKNPRFIIFRNITQILENLNYTINFFLYMIFNATFRRRAYALFGLRRKVTQQYGNNLTETRKTEALHPRHSNAHTESTSIASG